MVAAHEHFLQASPGSVPGRRSANLKEHALQLGFQKVGIVRAEPLSDEAARLRNWLEHGYHGEMKWMAREPQQRTDPRRIFPEARSVVVVALNYYTPHEHDVSARVGTASDSERIRDERRADRTVTGKVSRYAWGDDYHDIVGDKLRELLSWMKNQWPEVEGKVCVDIQPMMDKAWAARAGIGWMGKHTNIIAEDLGSWFFIGELLLNIELDYDETAVADQCGSCTLCIEACPTSAIVAPYVVDANRCISHATIESRAPEITAEVAKNLDEWLYGCDVCQDVCPWNQMTPETTETRFEPRDGNVNASLAGILELTPETYAERFRRSAIKRAKLSGLQRNARTLLENSERARTSTTS
jgi:epoxyqueuosine reductase